MTKIKVSNPDEPVIAQVIDLEEYSREERQPPVGRRYRVKVDSQHFIFDHHLVLGKDVLSAAGFSPVECYKLYLKLRNCDFELVALSETVDLSKPGIEHFIVKPTEVFHYLIDQEPEITDQKVLTPTQILELAGITPSQDYYLIQKNEDGSEVSYKGKPDAPIEMSCPRMVFISIFNGPMPVS